MKFASVIRRQRSVPVQVEIHRTKQGACASSSPITLAVRKVVSSKTSNTDEALQRHISKYDLTASSSAKQEGLLPILLQGHVIRDRFQQLRQIQWRRGCKVRQGRRSNQRQIPASLSKEKLGRTMPRIEGENLNLRRR